MKILLMNMLITLNKKMIFILLILINKELIWQVGH
jgi:hypothetical protein